MTLERKRLTGEKSLGLALRSKPETPDYGEATNPEDHDPDHDGGPDANKPDDDEDSRNVRQQRDDQAWQ
jgi:hypothetical protein